MNTHSQLSLPFSMAEASYAERENMLGLALMRCGCDLHLRVFVVDIVFRVTKGGIDGEAVKSYEELASRPRGLCCDAKTARRVVDRAVDLGLVKKREQRYASGSQKPNAYHIDWDGVRRALDLSRRPSSERESTDGQFVPPGGQIVQGLGQIDQGHGQNARHIKEDKIFLESSWNTFRTGPEEPAPQPMAVCDERLPDVPELAEALPRTVAPLPPGRLAYGAFAPVQENHLKQPGAMLQWFRQSLGVPTPVCSATEAHLLLVLAAALHAATMPQRDVQKTRVAVFASAVSRRRWQRVLHCVPEARRQLDELLQRHGRTILDGDLPTHGAAEVVSQEVTA